MQGVVHIAVLSVCSGDTGVGRGEVSIPQPLILCVEPYFGGGTGEHLCYRDTRVAKRSCGYLDDDDELPLLFLIIVAARQEQTE